MTKQIYNPNNHHNNPYLQLQQLELKLEQVKQNALISIMLTNKIYDKLTYCQEKKEQEKNEKKDF